MRCIDACGDDRSAIHEHFEHTCVEIGVDLKRFRHLLDFIVAEGEESMRRRLEGMVDTGIVRRWPFDCERLVVWFP